MYAQGKGILGTRKQDGVFEPKKCHAPIGLPKPAIKIYMLSHFTKRSRNYHSPIAAAGSTPLPPALHALWMIKGKRRDNLVHFCSPLTFVRPRHPRLCGGRGSGRSCRRRCGGCGSGVKSDGRSGGSSVESNRFAVHLAWAFSKVAILASDLALQGASKEHSSSSL